MIIRKVIRVGDSLATTLPIQWAELGTYVRITQIDKDTLKVEKVK